MASGDTRPAAGARRNRAIRSAVATSLASKLGTALLQLVSVPIAYRVLGAQEFGLYATVAMSIGFVVLLQFGVGPALTHGISRAVAAADEGRERVYFSTSWFLMLALSLLGAAVAGSLLMFVPLAAVFGEHYAGLEGRLRPALWLALGIVLLEFLLSHTERAREGYLQVSTNNAWGAAGNFVGAVAVGAGVWYFPTIEFLVLAVFGSHALARLANTVHLFLERPDLRPRRCRWDAGVARELVSDGLAFSVSHSLTTIIEVNACALIIAHMAGPEAVGVFNILMQLSAFMLGFVIMFTTPTWPSVVDAHARGDHRWIRAAARRLQRFVLAYGAAAVVGLTLAGPHLLPLWMGDEFEAGWSLLLPFSLYYLLSSWGHTNHSLLVGVGLVKRSAVYALIESLALLWPAYFGMAMFGLPGLFGGMALAMLAITGWIFPRMFLRQLEGNPGALPQPNHA